MEIEGQLNTVKRELITNAVTGAAKQPVVAIEVGTWLGGGSTLQFLRALQANGTGHLWGVEAFKSVYEKMIANIRLGAPEAVERFTPIFGFSTTVLPAWLASLPPGKEIDCVFLDGGDSPAEQIEEFKLLASRIRIGSIVMAHDARTRKGKWFVPYLAELDNWETQLLDLSSFGLLHARKLKPEPSSASRQAAERKLKRMQRNPIELTGRCMPRWLNQMILRLLPKKRRRKLTVGQA